LRYNSSAGKKINRELAIVSLENGHYVHVAATMEMLKVERVNGLYQCKCDEHSARCDMKTAAAAIEWAENHLRQHH